MKFVGCSCCDQRVGSLAFMVRGFALQPARTFLFDQYLTGQSLPADALFKLLG